MEERVLARAARVGGLLAVLCAVALPAAAGHILIFTSDAGVRVLEVEALLVNGKDTIRYVPVEQPAVADAGKLPNMKISQTRLVYRQAERKVLMHLDNTNRVTVVVPDGMEKKASGAPEKFWAAMAVSFRKSKAEKTPQHLNSTQIVAALTGGLDTLPAFCLDRGLLDQIAEPGKGFQLQSAIIRAALKDFGASPAMARLRADMTTALRTNLAGWDEATGGYPALVRGLEYAQLSEQVFAEDAEQTKLRGALFARKASFDRTMATLNALFEGGEFDAFLTVYRKLDRQQWDFPPLMERFKLALSGSIDRHVAAAEEWKGKQAYRQAAAELKRAVARNPYDSQLQDRYWAAWTDYSQLKATENNKRLTQRSASQRESIVRNLQQAERFKTDKRLDEALQKVKEAESIDANSIEVLLKRAEVHIARNELPQAFDVLERVDLLALDEKRDESNRLRAEAIVRISNVRKDTQEQVDKLFAERAFHRANRVALDSLKSASEEPSLLLLAGITSMVVRKQKEGLEHLRHYLDLPYTLSTDLARRREVYEMLKTLTVKPLETKGEPNWLSGRPLPPGAFYCPVSLAYQPRINTVNGSKKLTVSYVWDSGRLKSIIPSWATGGEKFGEQPVYFDYEPVTGIVRDAAIKEIVQQPAVAQRPRPGVGLGRRDAGQAKTGQADPDEQIRDSYVLLQGNPAVDLYMLEVLTGQRIGVTVAGNKFFQPFIWNGVYFYELSYDSSGRVRSAMQITDQAGTTSAGAPVYVEFDWDGAFLQAIRGFTVSAADRSKRTSVYERRMTYNGGKLTTETIRYQGSTAKINYRYDGNRLTGASFDGDPTLSGRSGEVTFTGSGS